VSNWADHEANVEPDQPDYPYEWTPAQRLTAYWYRVANDVTVQCTAEWPAILAAAEREGWRRHERITAILPPALAPTAVIPEPAQQPELGDDEPPF
jgi:hypothetical protein